MLKAWLPTYYWLCLRSNATIYKTLLSDNLTAAMLIDYYRNALQKSLAPSRERSLFLGKMPSLTLMFTFSHARSAVQPKQRGLK